MNPRVITLAIAGCFFAPAALAQSNDPITLYGRVYVTAESVEAKGQAGTPAAGGACAAPDCAAPVARRSRLSDQASNFGVRGTEDIGGGVKAFFQLETQFKPDQNDTTFANRNSGVGVKGGFGTFLLGRWDTPFKWANGNVDPFDDLTIAGFGTALQGSGIGNVNTQFDRRDQNVVQYWTPTMAGFDVRLSYSANEARTATSNPQSQGGSITWSNKAVYVGYSYHELKDQSFGVYGNAAIVQPAVLAVSTINVGKQTANSVFATFSIGPVKLGADYQEFKRTNPALPASMAPGTVVGFDKQKAWLANVVWTIGSHKLIYQYTTTKDGGQRNFDPRTTPASPECDANAIGYQYDFSRRTLMLVQYVRVKNNATATCNFGFNTIAIVPGQDPEGWSFGLKHVF